MISRTLRKVAHGGSQLVRRGHWELSCRFGYAPAAPGTGHRVGAVLLSYRRQDNIDPILRSLLRGNLIERVILSNNNPEVTSSDFVSVADERLTIIDQPQRLGAGTRWHVAHQMLADLDVVVAVDDDRFLYPRQIEQLVEHAISHPAAPHGVAGSLNRRPLARIDSVVDILWQAYVVTTDHVRRYMAILAELDTETAAVVERWGDDVVISATGDEPARIHDVGRLLKGPGSTDPDIALHRQPGFVTSRRQLPATVANVRSSLGWDQAY